jgi:mannose-6-phosphate isomerase-like protein (cupin superfamily)
MARCGDVYENHVTGERAVVLRGDEDGGGESVIVHLTVRPGGAVVGEHVHPALTERFVVISGTLATRIGGVEGALTAGEEATVAPGTPHDWWNSGAVDANVLVEISPPNPRFEMAIATTFGLTNAGKTNAEGMPNPLQLALVGQEFSDVIRFTKPPAAVQKVAFAALGAIARRRGYRGIYPEYLKPHGRATPDPEAMALTGLGPSGSSGGLAEREACSSSATFNV